MKKIFILMLLVFVVGLSSSSADVYRKGTKVNSFLSTNDFLIDVARGLIPGVNTIQKFGLNRDIDTAADEDIWVSGGTRVYLSSAETLDIVSDSASDDGSPQGVGAGNLTILGLDTNYNEISEVITLDGLTPVTTSLSYLRFYRAYVGTVGSSESNVGVITVDPTISGSGSRQGSITALDGQTLMTHYTVPSGKTAYMIGGQISIASTPGSTGVKGGIVKLFMRTSATTGWRLQGGFSARSDGTSITPDIIFTSPLVITEKSDMKWVGVAENNNTSIYTQYNLILFDN